MSRPMHFSPPHTIWMLACAALATTLPGPSTARASSQRLPLEAPQASTAAVARLDAKGMTRALDEQANRPLPRRLAHWSHLFLGTPYRVAPEDDEGTAGPGTLPRSHMELRWVDCESFVEQVMALSLSRRREDIESHLQRIRFRGGTPELSRLHFTVVKGWLAANRAAGHLKNITRLIGGPMTQWVERDLTPRSAWRPYYLQRFFSLGVHAPQGKARIDHIPMETALTARGGRLLRQIPSGTLVHLVSAPHQRSPYLVTHVGFVFQTSRGPVFRHASQSPHRRRVEDRPLGPYLTYVSRTPAGPEMRTAQGIHLSEVTHPPPH